MKVLLDLALKPNSQTLFCACSYMRTYLLLCRFEDLSWMQKNYLIRLICRRFNVMNQDIRLFVRKRRSAVEYHIDILWCQLIDDLVHKMLQLETWLWRLSTLGGALSAMAFFQDKFVESALQVSFKQLRIARILGDAILASRCRLYIAIALAQRQQFKHSQFIIRNEFREGVRLKSTFLCNCARGIWSQIKAYKMKLLLTPPEPNSRAPLSC